jgi:hypothetical protein
MLYVIIAVVGLCFIGAFVPPLARFAVVLISLVLLGGLGYLLSRAKPGTIDVATWAVCSLVVVAVVYLGWVIFGIRRAQGAAESASSRRRKQLRP